MKLRFGIVLASAFAVVSGACASGTGGGGGGVGLGPGGELLEQGEQPVSNSQTNQAQNRLGLAMAVSGDAAREHYAAALAQAEQAIRNDERNPLPWLLAGQAYLGLGEYVAADSVFQRAEALRPVYRPNIEQEREMAWSRLYSEGAELLNEGRYADVVPIYEDANFIYDRRPEIMVLLGQIYAQLDEHEKGIENLTRALGIINSPRMNEMDSATADIWLELAEDIPPALAQSFMATQRYDEAVATLRPMSEADPTNQAYAKSLASIYIYMGQADSARAVYNRLEAAIGDLAAADYYLIALGAYEMEDWAAAANGFSSVVRLTPRDRDAVEWMTRSLFEVVLDQEERGEADPDAVRQLVEATEAWLELDPNSYHAHMLLAQQLQRQEANQDRVVELIERLGSLTFFMEQMEIQKGRGGGATVWADVRGNSEEAAGQTVTVRFTFFGENGGTLGTEDVSVRLPPKEATEVLQVDFQSSQPVAGYTYQVRM